MSIECSCQGESLAPAIVRSYLGLRHLLSPKAPESGSGKPCPYALVVVDDAAVDDGHHEDDELGLLKLADDAISHAGDSATDRTCCGEAACQRRADPSPGRCAFP